MFKLPLHMKGLYIIFSLCFFLLLISNNSYSQISIEPLEDISDEDLELLDEFFEKAESLFAEGNYEEAIPYYNKVIAIDSADIDALNGIATSLENIGRHTRAIAFYDMVLAIDPLDIDALNGKALALISTGKHEEAISYYDTVLAIDSSDIDASYGKALVLETLGRVEEAISILEAIQIPETPAVFREPPEGTVNQVGVEQIAEADQTLFVFVGALIVILISIIIMDFFGRRIKSLLGFESATETKQTILSKPSGSHEIQFVKKEIKNEPTEILTYESQPTEALNIIYQNLMNIYSKTHDGKLQKELTNISKILTERANKYFPRKTRNYSIKEGRNEEKLESMSQNEKPEAKEIIEKTNPEVNQAIKVLHNLKDMNMLGDPKTAKQFLLNKGFSPYAVKNAMLGMGLDPSYVTDL